MDRGVRAQNRGDRGVEFQLRTVDDDPGVDGLPGDVEGIDLLPAVVVDGGIDSEEREDPERQRRPAVRTGAIVAAARVTRLNGAERGRRAPRELRAGNRERVRDPPDHTRTTEEDEPEVVALWRPRGGAGDHLDDRGPTARERERSRSDAGSGRRHLRLDLHAPRTGPLPGIRNQHRDRATCCPCVDVEIAE